MMQSEAGDTPPRRQPDWRSVIKVHPAAQMWPMVSDADLDAMGADIAKNGLQSPLVFYSPHPEFRKLKTRKGRDPAYQANTLPPAPGTDDDLVLIDGRCRLTAGALHGLQWFKWQEDEDEEGGGYWIMNSQALDARGGLKTPPPYVVKYAKRYEDDATEFDPWFFTISANANRRHLTLADKERLAAEVLKARPELSDRQVAGTVKLSHPKVAKIRKRLEKSGDVETVSTRVDKAGREQPAHHKPRSETSKPEPPKSEPPPTVEGEICLPCGRPIGMKVKMTDSQIQEALKAGQQDALKIVKGYAIKLDAEHWARFWKWCVEENERRAMPIVPMADESGTEKSAVEPTAPELEATTVKPGAEARSDVSLVASYEAAADLETRAAIYRCIMGTAGAGDPDAGSFENDFIRNTYRLAPHSEQKLLRAYFVQLKASPVQELAAWRAQ